jgi:hypothetical protein
MARNEAFARQAAAREQWERLHPILSGKIKIVDYVPPGNGKLSNVQSSGTAAELDVGMQNDKQIS